MYICSSVYICTSGLMEHGYDNCLFALVTLAFYGFFNRFFQLVCSIFHVCALSLVFHVMASFIHGSIGFKSRPPATTLIFTLPLRQCVKANDI